MLVVTVEQMRAVERAADANGHSYSAMMENAGRSVAQWLGGQSISGREVLVLVGPGNNGGDGLVAARHLKGMGARVSAYCVHRDAAGDSNWPLAEQSGVTIYRADADGRQARLRRLATKAYWIIDALLGTGVSRPITGQLQRTLEVVRQVVHRRRSAVPFPALWAAVSPFPPRSEVAPRILALDVPSGLNGDTGQIDPLALSADTTVTLGFPKLGLFLFPGAGYVGDLVIADIGIPPTVWPKTSRRLITAPDIGSLLPARPNDGHKGTFGKTLVVAGSSNYTGAPYLAASGAMRVGAGLVTLAVAEVLQPILASRLCEATFLLLPHELGVLVPDALRVLADRLEQYDSLLVGPGLGTDAKTVAFVSRLVCASGVANKARLGFVDTAANSHSLQAHLPPLVVDADALNALAQVEGWQRTISRPAILTPHPGEMARLLKTTVADVEARRVEVALTAAREWNVVIVLKGAHTLIATQDGELYISPFATPALATAGTGDVLAGVIAGLLAQGLAATAAAVSGVFVHGSAGLLAAEDIGVAGALASDLLPRLPLALRRIRGCAVCVHSDHPVRVARGL